MPKEEVNDIEIYYETRGEGSPLTLINGGGGSMDSWSPRMLDTLAEQHLVVTMDNRGTGHSGKPDIPYTMDMMAADAAGLLDSIGVEESHVMGFSMGGMSLKFYSIETCIVQRCIFFIKSRYYLGVCLRLRVGHLSLPGAILNILI